MTDEDIANFLNSIKQEVHYSTKWLRDLANKKGHIYKSVLL